MRSFRPVWNKSFGKITIFACGYLCRPHGKTKNWKKIKFQKEKQKTLNRVLRARLVGVGVRLRADPWREGGRPESGEGGRCRDPCGDSRGRRHRARSVAARGRRSAAAYRRRRCGSASCALPSSPKAWFSKNGNGLINPQKNYSKSKTAANCGLLLRPDLVFKKNP